MNTDHSSAKSTYHYQPTIIESPFLIGRLAIQIEFLQNELKRSWTEFKTDPRLFVTRSGRNLVRRLKKFLATTNAIPACLTAFVTVVCLVLVALLMDKTAKPGNSSDELTAESPAEVVMLNLESTNDSKSDSRFGKDGSGRVGFRSGTGEGSGPTPRRSQGGGGGGDRDPTPPQTGKPPPPSNIPAAIPIAPPIHRPSLPVAGIDIDPALWKDLKAPVYGDPLSESQIPSKGPGEDGGIGSNRGTGIGEGDGPGVGPGNRGNIGGGTRQTGCCDPGSGGPTGNDRTFSGVEVEQRARLLVKPEPQYTEEARRNQITGTVMLRVVFSSSGEVIQIRAVRTLPFGLTERAISAARQIKFVPAMKGGQPVSVHMQLEYNFNLY